MKNKRLVILGNGGAGLSAIRAIRLHDSSSQITLVSAGTHFAYSPVSLTHYISGEIFRERLFIADRDFYRNHGVELFLGSQATEIRPEISSVVIEGKKLVPFDRLLIATGASPVLSQEYCRVGILVLRTIEDAERIIDLARRCRNAIILGGGLVSLQLAQALWKRNLEVTVIVSSKQLLSRNVDVETASMIQRAMEKRGITIRLRTDVLSCERVQGSICLHLSSGEMISSPLAFCGKGIRPNRIQGPVCTNEHMSLNEYMQTCIDNIYGAGDVSLAKHLISDQWDTVANWPNACYQGWVAGCNMAGVPARLEGLINHNITTLFGITLVSIGLFEARPLEGYQILKTSDKKRGSYRKIILKGQQIVGALLVNDIQDAGIIRHLVSRRADISPFLNSSPVEAPYMKHHCRPEMSFPLRSALWTT